MIHIAKPIISREEKEAVMDVLESGQLAQGKKVGEFEKRFSEFIGSKNALATNSGTSALHCALYAAGISEGDEVITVPFTFIATVNSILFVGAKLVLVDIKEDTFNIDIDKIEEKITDKTKAILTVDLFGQPVDYDSLRKIADKYNLVIVEDACQAHAAEYKGKKAGVLGDIACFSFYATKNMICGEGGMITTNNERFADKCRLFRNHGQSEIKRYYHEDIGYNYRMMDLQAAIGIEQLKKLEGFTEKRIRNARLLSEGLKDVKEITVPFIGDDVKHVFHQYTLVCGETVDRDKLLDFLKEKGIGANVYYPVPLHLQDHIAKFGYKEGDFPVSERMSRKVLSLPVHPSVSEEEIRLMVDTIKEYFRREEYV